MSTKEGTQLYQVTVNVSLMENLAFAWSQHFYDESSFCDTWALDDITVVLQHNGVSRLIYRESFDKELDPYWNITEGIRVSADSIECSNDNGNCLYFTGAKSRKANRQAVSPFQRIRVVASVDLPTHGAAVSCNTVTEAL